MSWSIKPNLWQYLAVVCNLVRLLHVFAVKGVGRSVEDLSLVMYYGCLL